MIPSTYGSPLPPRFARTSRLPVRGGGKQESSDPSWRHPLDSPDRRRTGGVMQRYDVAIHHAQITRLAQKRQVRGCILCCDLTQRENSILYGSCRRRGLTLLARSHPYGKRLPDKLNLRQIGYTLVRTQQTSPKNTLRTPQLQLHHGGYVCAFPNTSTSSRCYRMYGWMDTCVLVHPCTRPSLTKPMPTFSLTHSIARPELFFESGRRVEGNL